MTLEQTPASRIGEEGAAAGGGRGKRAVGW
jgi:hypothetical protein